MAQYTKLDELAEKDRFILVYPNAYGGDWPLNSLRSKDGVGFFDALLQALTRKYIIDPNRVYLTGMSNGALYVHLLASQRSGQIAVIAAHSGSLGILASRGINAERKYPVMVIHGDADRTIPVQYARKTRDLYQKEGHEVEYVEIHNLGHTWASSYDINDKIWDFFARHPLKE
jgi:polyhydroxybutyrate depolymerase